MALQYVFVSLAQLWLPSFIKRAETKELETHTYHKETEKQKKDVYENM